MQQLTNQQKQEIQQVEHQLQQAQQQLHEAQQNKNGGMQNIMQAENAVQNAVHKIIQIENEMQ